MTYDAIIIGSGAGGATLAYALASIQKTLGVNQYYHGTDDFPYPLGHSQMLGKSASAEFKGDVRFAPEFALRELAGHAVDFWLTSDNLCVVDGSFFCPSTTVNSALTIMPNALRVGDHLRERFGVTQAERACA